MLCDTGKGLQKSDTLNDTNFTKTEALLTVRKCYPLNLKFISIKLHEQKCFGEENSHKIVR